LGIPHYIAQRTTWLAFDESGFVAGSLVIADGGFSVNGDAIVGLS
jgi:hypothetical protein